MLNNPLQAPRPRLTGPILIFGLADIFGLSCVAIGVSWLFTGRSVVLSDFPSSAAEAVACSVGGVMVMIWAIGRILRELAKQAPEMQARFDVYLNHRRGKPD